MNFTKFIMSEHVFRSVICRNDIKSVRRPSDRDVYWSPAPPRPAAPPPVQGESSPVLVKEPYSSLHDYL